MAPAPVPFDPIAEARRRWEQRWDGGDVMAAVTSVMRVQQLLMARINALLRPFGLTFPRYEALVLLEFTKAGALPLGRMGERLQVHPATVTNAVNRLEEQGFVRRIAHPTDGRATLAEITDRGRQVVREATRTLVREQFGAGALPPEARESLIATLTVLRVDAGDFDPEAEREHAGRHRGASVRG